MENQTSTIDFIANFGREGASILTFAGPIIFLCTIALGVFVWRKTQSRKVSIAKLAREIDSEKAAQSDVNSAHPETTADSPGNLKPDEPRTTDQQSSAELSTLGIDFNSPASRAHAIGRSTSTSEISSLNQAENGLSANSAIDHESKIISQKDRNAGVTSISRLDNREIESVATSDQSSSAVAKSARIESSHTPIIASSWIERLRQGLSKTRSQLSSSLSGMFSSKPKLDEELLEKIHEAIYKADMGVQIADLLVNSLKSELPRGEVFELSHISNILKQKISEIFLKSDKSENAPESGPKVILIVGVNGVGKTTTVGKLAAWQIKQNRSVLLCAADTFRAAAIEQLSIWAERVGVPIVAHKQGADPAAVAFDGVKAGKARGMDTVIIDTAGRLHNKAELMAELGKVTKVIQKEIPSAPHETWIVVDATTGQNAIQQVKAFGEVTPLTGVIVTKLDGTAKGGIVAAISHQFGLPIRYIGVGEAAEDLRPFKPQEFVASLF